MKKTTFIIECGNVGSDGIVIMPGAFKNLPKEMPLTRDFKQTPILGHANIFDDNGIIKAEGEIDESLFDLTPAIGFQVLKSREENGIKIIDEANLRYVSLNAQPNADPNIKSIREQLSK